MNRIEASSGARIWRCSGGDSTRCGLFPGAISIKTKPAFALKTAGAVQASVVFDEEGFCYVADMTGLVQAFLKDRQIWQNRLNGSVVASPALCPKSNVLFVGTTAGSIYAIDTKSGKTLIKKDIPTTSDPRILSDIICVEKTSAVILNSWGGKYYVLKGENLEEIFCWDAGITPYAGACADSEGNIYCLRAVASRGVEFVKIAASGQESVIFCEPESLRGARRTIVAAAPIIDNSGGRIYFTANRDIGAVLCAVSIETGVILWKIGLPNAVQAAPVLRSDGSVMIFDLRGVALCFGKDGSFLFQYKTDAEYIIASGAVEDAGTVFFGDPLGNFHQLNKDGSGRIIFKSQRAILSRPSFSPQGNIYLPSTDKNVYVFVGNIIGPKG